MSNQPRRQPSSALCFVCGTENPHGLRVEFFDDGTRVFSELYTQPWQQSWPGVLHGGIITALLDETIGRVAFLHDRWVQTAKLSVRFIKPAPLGRTLRATGELVRDAKRLMQMQGTLIDVETGENLAEAEGTFIRVPDTTRDELAKQLGGDFAMWEQWLSQNRAKSSVLTFCPNK